MTASANARAFNVGASPFLPLPGLSPDRAIQADVVDMLKMPAGECRIVPEDVHEGTCLQGVVSAFLFEAIAGLAVFLLWQLLKAIF